MKQRVWREQLDFKWCQAGLHSGQETQSTKMPRERHRCSLSAPRFMRNPRRCGFFWVWAEEAGRRLASAREAKWHDKAASEEFTGRILEDTLMARSVRHTCSNFKTIQEIPKGCSIKLPVGYKLGMFSFLITKSACFDWSHSTGNEELPCSADPSPQDLITLFPRAVLKLNP